MKNLFYNLMRLSGISVLISIVAISIGIFLQAKKANISDSVSSQYFDSIMRMYYLGTKIKSIAAWVLLISITVGIIAGILYMIKR